MILRAEFGGMGCEDGRRGHELGKQGGGALEAGKGKEMNSPLGTSRTKQPC